MFTGYSMFMTYEYKDTTNTEYLKSNIYLKGLGIQCLKQNPVAEKVYVDLYLYHYPTLNQLISKELEKPKYVLYTRKVIHKDEVDWN